MTDMERQVIVNTTHIAMIMKMFWVIIGGVVLNIATTIFSVTKNGKVKK